tara:strand:+ start:140807 stop:141199 length:393 start_codon:yes stop_codon:yes gene_type:complete
MLKYKTLYICVLLAGLVGASHAAAQQGDMLKDMALPLMGGLAENSDGAMLFDSPEGRIINAEASGMLAAKDVYEYYRVVLPSLGWSVERGAPCDVNVSFCIKATRDAENLLLDIASAGNKSTVTYALAPN